MFDYYYYETALRRAGWGLVLISAAAAVLAFVWAERIEPDYQVHFSYLVSLSEREAGGDFRYDGYYALSATDLFTATLAAWAKTPEVIAAAYERSNLAVPSLVPRAMLRSVEANKTGPQLVQIVVRHSEREAAQSLAEGLQEVMKENIARYQTDGIPALKFEVVPTEPWTGVNSVAAVTIAVGTFVVVLFGGLNLVLLKASLIEGATDERE